MSPTPTTGGRLPEAFADLEPLAQAGWCLGSEQERLAKRHASSAAELQTFYDLFAPRLEAVVAHLDAAPGTPRDFGEPDQHLMWLLLAMAEVSFAVEKFGADESDYRGIEADRFVPVHELEAGGLPVPNAYRSS